jgi:hypothetical protein
VALFVNNGNAFSVFELFPPQRRHHRHPQKSAIISRTRKTRAVSTDVSGLSFRP